MSKDQKVAIGDAVIEGKKNGKPIVVEEAKIEGNVKQIPSQSLPADTTQQQDITREGQRRINLIWEGTQAIIAVIVTGATIYAALAGVDSLILGNAFTLIIAIYFVRMNHIKTGGIGGTDSR